MLSLYYDSLKSVFDFEKARLKRTSHRNFLLNPAFHEALLSICLICVVQSTSRLSSKDTRQQSSISEGHLFAQSILKLMDCTAYEYMQCSKSFVQSMEKTQKVSTNKSISCHHCTKRSWQKQKNRSSRPYCGLNLTVMMLYGQPQRFLIILHPSNTIIFRCSLPMYYGQSKIKRFQMMSVWIVQILAK